MYLNICHHGPLGLLAGWFKAKPWWGAAGKPWYCAPVALMNEAGRGPSTGTSSDAGTSSSVPWWSTETLRTGSQNAGVWGISRDAQHCNQSSRTLPKSPCPRGGDRLSKGTKMASLRVSPAENLSAGRRDHGQLSRGFLLPVLSDPQRQRSGLCWETGLQRCPRMLKSPGA